MNAVHKTAGKLVELGFARSRTLGDILVDAGRLDAQAVDRILELQKSHRLRFGEAAVSLGVLTPADIEFALARQFAYPLIQRGDAGIHDDIVAAYAPFTAEVEALRAVRSSLMLQWLQHSNASCKSLAVMSLDAGDGRSWFAANLAVVFSQLGERTLLIDADLRKPRQHQYFGVNNRAGLSEVLCGRCSMVDALYPVPQLLDLSVIASGAVPPNPQEVLARSELEQLLKLVQGLFDVVIIDTPPAREFADAAIVASRASSALLVARRHRTEKKPLAALASSLRTNRINLAGSVVVEH